MQLPSSCDNPLRPMYLILMWLLLPVSSLSLAADQTAHAVSSLDTPAGGWNFSGLTDHSNAGRVSYPTPPIDRGMRHNRSAISGQIIGVNKQHPPVLIVNGNPMRLNVDANSGHYTRFYAFGGGSNSVEVKTATQQPNKRIQFYESHPNQVAPQLRIVCAWDAPEAEVDLHVLTPDGQHVSFAETTLIGGGGLDSDSVDGPGPEMFTSARPKHGQYQVYVNYWGNYSDAEGYNFNQENLEKPIITTRITLVFNENTPREKRESFVVPLRKIGELTLVKSFIY